RDRVRVGVDGDEGAHGRKKASLLIVGEDPAVSSGESASTASSVSRAVMREECLASWARTHPRSSAGQGKDAAQVSGFVGESGRAASLAFVPSIASSPWRQYTRTLGPSPHTTKGESLSDSRVISDAATPITLSSSLRAEAFVGATNSAIRSQVSLARRAGTA